ncbi:MAG: leucyl/phenylalanyl-tRNA---protein transferase [Pyrinomonadaceae bacterium]|jgi:leucyl/phenylalanyl-tRNA--protein transferase|nr:leucyl/phenylalanyl-tRNA---protein transferase [Pyrinomonadaceae bacterium]
MSETETSTQHPALFFKRDVSLINFPDPRDAPFGDIVAVGGNLHPLNLERAYARGIFPWPIEGWPLTWFSPQERAIIEFANLKVPRSLSKVSRRAPYRITIDAAFPEVILACARVKRADEQGTWITPDMFRAYCRLHELGHAHSVEAWENDVLVGGLYGVDAGGAFAGESMFYLRPNASKLALLHLIEHLSARGLDWLDIQVMTPHMRALGARTVTRCEFLERLAAARARKLKLFGAES